MVFFCHLSSIMAALSPDLDINLFQMLSLGGHVQLTG